MSAPTLSAWAFEEGQARKFPPSVRLVLLALAKLAKDQPAIHDLMDGTGLCRRSVINAIAALEKSGLVTIDRQPGDVSVYHLAPPQGGANTSANGGANGSANGGAIPTRARVSPSLPLSLPKKELPPAFVEFWGMYPRKEAKPNAVKAWHAATNKGHKPSEMLGGLASWLQQGRFSPDPKYIPLPASWLNAERWSDEKPLHRETVADGWRGTVASPSYADGWRGTAR